MNVSKMNVSKFFDSKAKKYENELKYPIINRARLEEKKIIHKLLLSNISHNYSVFEIGCGTGYYTLKLSEICKRVTAIDISNGMLAVLMQKLSLHKIKNVEVIEKDFKEMDFNIYDVVFSAGVIDYADNPRLFLNRCFSFCKKKIIITAPNYCLLGKIWRYASSKKGIRINLFSRQKLMEMMCSAGFRNVRICEAGKPGFFSGLTLIAIGEK